VVFISSLLFSGLVVLSLSMKRHHQQIREVSLDKSQINTIRYMGWSLLMVSLALCFYSFGFGVGLATFFAILSFVGFMQIGLMSYAPKSLLPLSIALPLSSGSFWLIGYLL